jgi:hypothetical protein
MRGWQIMEELRRQGHDARMALGRRVLDVHNSVVIFVKYLDAKVGREVMANGNLVFADPIDWLWVKKMRTADSFHTPIFFNQKMAQVFKRKHGRNAYVIPHHHDPRHYGREFYSFKLGFVGYSKYCQCLELADSVKGRYYTRDQALCSTMWNDCSCHYSIRSGFDSLSRSGLKASNAAACGANIITTPDQSVVELLGRYYPYYTVAQSRGIRQTIAKARREYKGPEWQRGLDMMEAVRQKTTVEVITKQYIDMIERES